MRGPHLRHAPGQVPDARVRRGGIRRGGGRQAPGDRRGTHVVRGSSRRHHELRPLVSLLVRLHRARGEQKARRRRRVQSHLQRVLHRGRGRGRQAQRQIDQRQQGVGPRQGSDRNGDRRQQGRRHRRRHHGEGESLRGECSVAPMLGLVRDEHGGRRHGTPGRLLRDRIRRSVGLRGRGGDRDGGWRGGVRSQREAV